MPRQSVSLTPILLIWLVPQLLSLVLSASRVPLSAHPPKPIESVAAQQMIIVQMATMTMLAPLLFRSAASVAAVILTMAPMLQLAGFLSSFPLGKISALYQCGSSLALATGCCCLLVEEPKKLLISAAAAGWAIGGLVLAYLYTEFPPARRLPGILFGPAYIALDVARREKPSPTFWVLVGTLVTIGVAAACAAFLRRRRDATC